MTQDLLRAFDETHHGDRRVEPDADALGRQRHDRLPFAGRSRREKSRLVGGPWNGFEDGPRAPGRRRGQTMHGIGERRTRIVRGDESLHLPLRLAARLLKQQGMIVVVEDRRQQQERGERERTVGDGVQDVRIPLDHARGMDAAIRPALVVAQDADAVHEGRLVAGFLRQPAPVELREVRQQSREIPLLAFRVKVQLLGQRFVRQRPAMFDDVFGHGATCSGVSSTGWS